MENKIIEFYNNLKINLQFVKKISSLRITSYLFTTDFSITKINKMEKTLNELAAHLKRNSVMLKIDNLSGCVVFEIENQKSKPLLYNEINKKNSRNIVLNLGKSVDNKIINTDMCKLPHLLIAGTTGSGKSVFVNSLICQLIENYSIDEIKLLLIDVKFVEFSLYRGLPLLYSDIVTNVDNAKESLNNVLEEITQRFELFAKCNCRNIDEYNATSESKKQKIFIFIDELADLLMQDKKHKIKNDIENNYTIEEQLIRIAQIGRAAGVHLIVATQRPSVDIITGLLKANIPSRISLSVASATNSKVILDEPGAEKLIGNGDMYFKNIGNKELIRIQGAYISNDEIVEIVNKCKEKNKSYMLQQEKKQIEIMKKQQFEEAERISQEKREKNKALTFKILKIILYTITCIVFLPIVFCFLVVMGACKHSK